jgi:hypothetical protein
MQIEKGVFDSTIGLLLDIPSKSKDGLSAHKYHQALEIGEELHPLEISNGRAYLSPASYTGAKGNLQVSAWDQSPHRILNKH